MKTLLFTENFYAGGMDSFIVNLINYWPSDDEFILMCNHDHPGLEIIEKRLTRPCRIIRHKVIIESQLDRKFSHSYFLNLVRKFSMLPGQYLLLLYHILYFNRAIKKLGPDRLLVVAGNYPGGNTCRSVSLTGLFNQKWGKPLLVYHNQPVPIRKVLLLPESLIDFYIEKSVASLITVSHFTQRHLSNRPGIGFSKKKKVIYNGIEIPPETENDKQSIRSELNISSDAPILLMLGTYEKRKGHEFLLQSFLKVKKACPESQLIIAGYGYQSEYDHVVNLVEERKLESCVHLLRFRNDVANLIKECDIMVAPSQKDESFGLTIIEAMALQTPVIAANVGGMPEVLENGKGGFVIELNTDSFADKIIELFKDAELRKEIGEEGRRVFLKKFYAKRMAEDYLSSLSNRDNLESDLNFLQAITGGVEFENFLKYSLNNSMDGFISYVIKRVKLKLINKKAKQGYWYPAELKAIINSKNKPDQVEWKLPCTEKTEDRAENNNEFSVKSLKLAGCELQINENIPWNQNFADDEDFESLHRWNWLLTALSQHEGTNYSNISKWGENQITDWFDQGYEEGDGLIWESYTAGERISNAVLFFYLTGYKPSAKIQNGLMEFAAYLINNLEYMGPHTGNHVLNNGRALFLAGCAFDDENLLYTGKIIILREIRNLVTSDGFLREGSSHYHFLFTRWVLEFCLFAEITGQDKLKDELAGFAKKLLKNCWFFLVYNEKEKDWDMPLIGDISPDFSPSWLIDLPWSRPAVSIYTPKDLPANPKAGGYGSLFRELAESSGENIALLSNRDKIQSYTHSGWHRVDKCGSTLIWRAEQTATPKHVGHGHCDIGAFCLYINGYPFLTDCGRLNYKQDEWGSFGSSAKAHNSVCIDGFEPAPIPWNRYPAYYSQSKLDVELTNSENGTDIELSLRGYRRLPQPVEIKRKLLLREKSFAIEDEILGKGTRNVSVFFHFASGATVNSREMLNKYGVAGRFGNAEIFFETGNKEFNIDCFDGGDSPLGWRVNEYGMKIPGATLRLQNEAKIPLKLKSMITWD